MLGKPTKHQSGAQHGLGQREAKIIGELWELVALGSGVLQFHTHLRHCIHRGWWVWAWAILQTKNITSTATQCPCPSLYCKCASKLLEKPQSGIFFGWQLQPWRFCRWRLHKSFIEAMRRTMWISSCQLIQRHERRISGLYNWAKLKALWKAWSI